MAPLSRVAALVVGLALLVPVGVAAGAGAPGQPPLQVTDDGPAGNTSMAVELAADGDAQWRVTMRVELEDPMAAESFRSVGSAFEAGDSDVLSIETFRQFADRASQTTGRDMQITNVTRDATVHDEQGQLEVQFTWRNFGRRDGEMLYVDDAFETPGGIWLDGLGPNQQLTITAPGSFDITSSPKGFTNKTIRWSGPTAFEPSYLSISYRVDGTGGLPVSALTLAIVGGIVAVVVAIAIRRDDVLPGDRLGADAKGDAEATESAPGRPASADVESEDSGGTPAEPSGDGPAEPVAASQGQPESDAESVGETTLPDRELLSDEEYVEALIEHNGGRMKQATIVRETGWSNAKVSQLLSAMAEEGRIEKLRIGRENLISFPDEDDTAPE